MMKMKDYDSKIVGEKIKKYRLAKNMSQKELSKQVGISPSYLGSLENGGLSKNGSGSLKVICGIAETLGVTLDDLAGENLECRQLEITGINRNINRIMQEIESVSYSRLVLFKNVITALLEQP